MEGFANLNVRGFCVPGHVIAEKCATWRVHMLHHTSAIHIYILSFCYEWRFYIIAQRQIFNVEKEARIWEGKSPIQRPFSSDFARSALMAP